MASVRRRERDEAERLRRGAARLFRIAQSKPAADAAGWANWRRRLARQLEILLVELRGRRVPARHREVVDLAARLWTLVK